MQRCTWPTSASHSHSPTVRSMTSSHLGPLATFWRAVHDIDPHVRDESELAGAREGHLAELCQEAHLNDIEPLSLTVTLRFATFDDWWEPFRLGVGPAGAYVAQLDEAQRDGLRTDAHGSCHRHRSRSLPQPGAVRARA
jgi:hypothetical protein